jgi:endoribonuclease LACTB2
MPGWHAFPGGALHRVDAGVELTGRAQGFSPGNSGLSSMLPGVRLEGDELASDPAPGILCCALRELFEETGVLPLPEGTAPEPEALAAARSRVLEDPGSFAAELGALGLPLDPSSLVFAGRWLTPPFAPVRYDNRFFLLEHPRERPLQPEILPGELAEGEWVAPARALERWGDAEVIAAPPVLHILGVLADSGPEEGLPRLRDPAEATLGPAPRIEFRPGVVMLPLATPTLPPATHTNCYLLGTREAVVVDPGSPFPGEQKRLLEALAVALDDMGRLVTAIWLTHHHPDHVGGAVAAARALSVAIEAHAATAARLAARGIEVTGALADGDVRQLGAGFSVRVLHTPGHARGHLAFLVEGDGTLLCGDLISALSTIVVDPPEGHMGDYLGSLERCRDLAPRFLFPAHGPVLRDGARVLDGFLAHRHGREQRILAAWRDGRREPAELVAAAYDGLDPTLLPVAQRQAAAHVEHLREQGLIRP